MRGFNPEPFVTAYKPHYGPKYALHDLRIGSAQVIAIEQTGLTSPKQFRINLRRSVNSIARKRAMRFHIDTIDDRHFLVRRVA